MVQRKIFDIKLSSRQSSGRKVENNRRVTKNNSTHINTLYESFKVLKYYKDLVRNAWRSHLSKVEAAKALERVFGDEQLDVHLLSRITSKENWT